MVVRKQFVYFRCSLEIEEVWFNRQSLHKAVLLTSKFEPNPRKVIYRYFQAHRFSIFHYVVLLAVPAIIALIGLALLIGLLAAIKVLWFDEIEANLTGLLLLDWYHVGAAFIAIIGFGTLLFFSLWSGEVTIGGSKAKGWLNREIRLIATLTTFLQLSPFYWGIYAFSVTGFTLIAVLLTVVGFVRWAAFGLALIVAAPILIVPYLFRYVLSSRMRRAYPLPEFADDHLNDAVTTERAAANWAINFLATLLKTRLSRVTLGLIVLPLLTLLAILWPITLGYNRLTDTFVQRIGPQGGTLRAVDNSTFDFAPEGIKRAFWIKLTAIPRSAFLEGNAGENLLPAAQNIPANLVMKSPFYYIQQRGAKPTQVHLRLARSTPEELPQNWDVYAWDGQRWLWQPSQLQQTAFEATLDELPQAVAVMETEATPLQISANYRRNDPLPDKARQLLAEINPEGFQLGSNGAVHGIPEDVVPDIVLSAFKPVPILRNWEGKVVKSDLLASMLRDQRIQARHIDLIVDLVRQHGYGGIDLDYRSLDPTLSRAYVDFLSQLREALPSDRQISVWLPLPEQSDGTWQSGAYDWPAIGQIVDVIKIPPLDDPHAYVLEGPMASLLAWAASQIDRTKLQPVVRVSSLEKSETTVREISYQEIFERLGQISVVEASDPLIPGQPAQFSLAGLQDVGGINIDEMTGNYSFRYADGRGDIQTIYLGNAATLSNKLQFLAQYHLRGVLVQNLLSTDIDPRVWQVLDEFPNLPVPPLSKGYSVHWEVSAESGRVDDQATHDLSEPAYTWIVSDVPSVYQISAEIAVVEEGALRFPVGSVSLTVETPVVRPTLTPQLTNLTPTPVPSPIPSPTLVLPTPAPANQPTALPEALGPCPNPPRGEFAALWQANVEVFGCPVETEPLYGAFVEMPFERGQIVWMRDIERYANVRLAIAIVGGQNQGDTGRWLLQNETWNGEGICPVGPPPEGLFLPDRNIAQVWCDLNGLDVLGYATAPLETEVTQGEAAIQNFDEVILLKDRRGNATRLVYVLNRADNSYVRLAY